MNRIVLAFAFFTTPLAAQEWTAEKVRNLDIRLFPVGSAEAKEASDLFYKALKAERDKRNVASLQWKFGTKAEWETLRDEKIAQLKKHLGHFPEVPKEVAVYKTKTIPGDGFAIDNILYESRPGFYVTANLYRPAGDAKPNSRPAILLIHSHHNPKTQGELQDMGMLWARAGCYVLIPDMLGHGERRAHPFVDDKSFDKPFKAGRQDYHFRFNTGVQLALIGDSLAGWMAWDMSRGVDVLLKLPGIDPKRIALLGSVAGGGDPAAVTAALDKRIGVLVPFNFGGPQPETKFPLPEDAEASFNYIGGGSWESTRNLRGTGSGGFLPWVMVASIAPRGLIHAHEFAWDKDRDPAWKRYQQIWGYYGAQDKVAFTHGRGSVKGKAPESTHCNNIGVEHRKQIHTALNDWFKIDAKEYSNRVPSADLQCWTPELREKLKPKPLHVAALEWAEQRQKDERSKLEENLTAWKTRLAQAKYDEKMSERQSTKSADVFPFVIFDKSLPIPVRINLLVPHAAPKPLSVVIGLAQQGSQGFLKHRAEAIAELLNQGICVALVDLPGTGETQPGSSLSRTSYATSVSSLAQMLGLSATEIRLQMLQAAIYNIEGLAEFGMTTAKFALWGDSFVEANGTKVNVEVPYDVDNGPKVGEPAGGMIALLAPLVTKQPIEAIYIHGGLASYRSVLDSSFVHVPHDALEPGMMAKFDLPEVAGRFAPRPLKLEGLINGRNQAVADADLKATYAPTHSAYEKNADRFTVRAARSSDKEIAAWFVKALQGK